MSSLSSVKVVSRARNRVTFEIDIELAGSLLELEDSILSGCNQLGCLATTEALQRFDADGSPLEVAGVKLTSRAQSTNQYHTPYGTVEVRRHVYQTAQGGRIYCPLEAGARMVERATPRMAKLLSSK